MNKRMMTIIGFLLISGCAPKTYIKGKSVVSANVKSGNSLIFDADRKTAINAAELIDLGTVAQGQSNVYRLNILNSTPSPLNLSFDDFQAKLAQNHRITLTNNTCTPVLKINKSCSMDLTLVYLESPQNEDYTQSIVSNIIVGETNPEFGKIVLVGQKANDVSAQLALSNVLKLDHSVDNYIIPFGKTVSKRFYIGNSSTVAINAPVVLAPSDAVLSKNTCSGSYELKPNKTCFFDLDYTSTSDSNKQNYASTVSFQSNDSKVNSNDLQLALNITNQAEIIQERSVGFQQVGKLEISDVKTTRLYVLNTGAATIDATVISLPEPYVVKSTSCTTDLKVNNSCYVDVSLDLAKAAHMTGVVSTVTYNTNSFNIKAGTATGSLSVCSSGYLLTGNACVASSFNPQVTNVSMTGDQIVITGLNFDEVSSLSIKKASGSVVATSNLVKTANSITAKITQAIAFSMNETFNLLISNASAQSLEIPAVFNVADGSVTLAKLSGAGLQPGQFLKWNGTAFVGANASQGQVYKGAYNPTINSPDLSQGTYQSGDYVIASAIGSIDIGGSTIQLAEGDWLIFNGTSWDKLVNNTSVASFNGRKGSVLPLAGDYGWADLKTANSKITGSSIMQIADVVSSGWQDGNALVYDATTNKFKPGSIPAPDLSGYVTTGALTSSLIPYAKMTDLDGYVKTADLSAYITNTGLATTLNGYVTTGALTTELSSYVTSAGLPALINGKADVSNISQIITAAAITGLSAPQAGSDAANKDYVDGKATAITSSLGSLATKSEVSNLDIVSMDASKVTGVLDAAHVTVSQTPVADTDVSNKLYVDSAISSISSSAVPGLKSISIGATDSGTTVLNSATKIVYITSNSTNNAHTINLPSTATMKVGQKIEIYNLANGGTVTNGADVQPSGSTIGIRVFGSSTNLNTIPYLLKAEFIVASTTAETWTQSYSYLRDSNFGLNVPNRRIINLLDPTGNQDASTKKYVDTSITNLGNTATGLFEPKITAGSSSQYLKGDKTLGTLNTDAVVEGTNQYFTNARAQSALTSTLSNYVTSASVQGSVLSTTLSAAFSTATNAVTAAGDSILVAIGKLQAQITAAASSVSTSLDGKADRSSLTQAITAGTVNATTLAAATGSVTASPVLGTDIANKTYVDSNTPGSSLVCGTNQYLTKTGANTFACTALPTATSNDYDYKNVGAITIGATTTAPTKGTTTIDRIWASRKGQNLIAKYQYDQAASSAAGTGDYLLSLPVIGGTQLQFDSTIVNFYTGAATAATSSLAKAIVGYGKTTGDTSIAHSVILIAYNSTQFRLLVTYSTNSSLFANQSGFGFANPAGAGYGLELNAPISGWIGNTAVLADVVTVAASYYASATFASSTTQPSNFDAKIFDTSNAVTVGSSWKFTAPIAGKYEVYVFFNGGPTPASADSFIIYKNGASAQFIGFASAIGNTGGSGSGIISLNAGDYIDVRNTLNSNYGGGAITGSTSFITIKRIGL